MPLYASEHPLIVIEGGAKKKKSRSRADLPPRNRKTGRFMKRSRASSKKSKKSRKSRK